MNIGYLEDVFVLTCKDKVQQITLDMLSLGMAIFLS